MTDVELMVERYSTMIREWSIEDERLHGCRRRARRLVHLWTRACREAGIIPTKELDEKARHIAAFGRFEDMG